MTNQSESPASVVREQYRQEYTGLIGKMDTLTLDWVVRVSPPVREAAADWMISIACLPDDTSTEEILHSVLAARRQICQLALDKATDIWIDKRERELFARFQDMSADDYR